MKFDKIAEISGKAFGRIDKVTNTDTDLDIYQKLNTEAFEKIAQKYGADETEKYIKAMEFERLKNG